MNLKIIFILLIFTAKIPVAALQHSGRDSWQQPQRIIDSLNISEGMIIGEAGAGRGYFTFHLAQRVGEKGHIYANDISERALKAIDKRIKEDGISNITTVHGEFNDPTFPVDTLDMVIMMRAFHDFEYPVEWMKNVQQYMRPQARVVIIDPDPDKAGHGRGHFKTRQEILDIMARTDFKLVEVKDFLQQDYIYIYKLK
jgi:ubiquinone/menaquinone biosynthesis C-methylase UbiE